MRKFSTLCAVSLMAVCAVQPSPAIAKTKYAKTEVDKAIGKCFGSVLGGALLGALVGGKNRRAEGALVGAAAGGVVCAIIMRNAKRKDEILAAQQQTAISGGSYSTVFRDDEGNSVSYVGTVGEAKTYDAGKLIPVKYTAIDGSTARSPMLETGGAECRRIDSALSYGGEASAGLPNQVFCRTAAGDWQPYSPSA